MSGIPPVIGADGFRSCQSTAMHVIWIARKATHAVTQRQGVKLTAADTGSGVMKSPLAEQCLYDFHITHLNHDIAV